MNKLFWATLLLFSLSGCVYHANLHQGNIIAAEAVDQLQPGMTHNQVISLLGTPLITDSFHTNRWDYYSYSKTGKKRVENTSRLTLIFSNDLLESIER